MYQTIGNMKRPRKADTRVVENYASNALKNGNRTFKNNHSQRVNKPQSRNVEMYSNINQGRVSEGFSLMRPKQPRETFESKDPKSLWGRPLWFTLHYGALNYPDEPDSSMRNMMVGYIQGLPIMIPCDICKNHAYEYISNCTTTKLWDVTENKRTLFRFFWEFHNDVNARVGKPTMSLQEAYNLYENNPKSSYA